MELIDADPKDDFSLGLLVYFPLVIPLKYQTCSERHIPSTDPQIHATMLKQTHRVITHGFLLPSGAGNNKLSSSSEAT